MGFFVLVPLYKGGGRRPGDSAVDGAPFGSGYPLLVLSRPDSYRDSLRAIRSYPLRKTANTSFPTTDPLLPLHRVTAVKAPFRGFGGQRPPQVFRLQTHCYHYILALAPVVNYPLSIIH